LLRGGKDGAHQLINRTNSAIRVLMLSSMISGRHRVPHRQVLAKGRRLAEDVMLRATTVEYRL
jgi:hypothetical protein